MPTPPPTGTVHLCPRYVTSGAGVFYAAPPRRLAVTLTARF